MTQKRGRRCRWIPHSVEKIAERINLIITTHPAAWEVLTGTEPWPTASEWAEMIAYRYGNLNGEDVGRVQGGDVVPEAQRSVEAEERGVRYMTYLDKYGGARGVIAAFAEFVDKDPEGARVIRLIADCGKPYAKTETALAGEYHMSRTAFWRYKWRLINNIAFGVSARRTHERSS